MKLALFDLDGTITNKNSFLDFLFFSFGRKKFVIAFPVLLSKLIFHKLKFLPDKNYQEVKEIVFEYYFNDYYFDKLKGLTDVPRKNRTQKRAFGQNLDALEIIRLKDLEK